jgi:hypothetical protein
MRKALTWTVAGSTIAAAMLSMTGIASAATTPAARTGTALSAAASKATVVPGGSDVIRGTLKAGRKDLAGQFVELDVVGSSKPLKGARTGKNGAISFSVAPTRTTEYKLVFGGTKTLAGSRSGDVKVKVAKEGTKLSISESAAKKGEFVIGGTLRAGRSDLANQFVELDVVGAAKPLKGARTGKHGAVSFTVKPSKTTRYELVFGGTKTLAGSRSAIVTIKVK